MLNDGLYDGAGGAMRDTLGGHTDVAIGPPGVWQPHVDSSAVRHPLLVNEEHRDRPGIADLEISADYGPNYEITLEVQGVFLKTGAPKEVTDRIAAALKSVSEHPR